MQLTKELLVRVKWWLTSRNLSCWSLTTVVSCPVKSQYILNPPTRPNGIFLHSFQVKFSYNEHWSTDTLCKYTLAFFLLDVQWTVISAGYLNLKGRKTNETSTNTSTWRDFLSKLGVQDGLAIERVNEPIDPQEEVCSPVVLLVVHMSNNIISV